MCTECMVGRIVREKPLTSDFSTELKIAFVKAKGDRSDTACAFCGKAVTALKHWATEDRNEVLCSSECCVLFTQQVQDKLTNL